MNKKVAYIFPGQGAQFVGMGKDFYDEFPLAKEVFLRADEILGRNFSSIIFEGPQEELTKTANSQLAIYIVSYAIYSVFKAEHPNIEPSVCAGLSLGEYTALTAAGKLSFDEGLLLVEKRAALMQEACEKAPGSLKVVLGMEEEAIKEVFARSKEHKTLCIANINCPGQIVIAGSHEDLAIAEKALKEAGAKRVLPLDVSGAFHSSLMNFAREGLTPYLKNTVLKDTPVGFVMNTPGDFVENTDSIIEYLICQVTQPVRWQKGIEAMEASGVTHYIEMGPGSTLQGMNKRIGVQGKTDSISIVADLQKIEVV